MPFNLDNVVPWGRSFDEYVAMFALSDADLHKRILGCGDGPAAFNAQLTRRGGRVVSVDPLYECSAQAIEQRIEASYPQVMEQTRHNEHEFVWSHIRSVDELGRVRMDAMRTFLADYPQGVADGRYVAGTLPHLPWDDGAFDLAVCSHLLFLYSEQLDMAFHLAAIGELCRVADEVRIFPLLELGAIPSRHLQAVLSGLADSDYTATISRVGYEFQRGGNEMLIVRRPPPSDR